MESFFHTLKTELVHHTHYATRAEATRDIFAYIEGFYNRTRRHSASPIEMELKQLKIKKTRLLGSSALGPGRVKTPSMLCFPC